MEILFPQLVGLLERLWWPFCRVLALLTAAPMIGDHIVPMRIRVLLAIAAAFLLLPVLPGSSGIAPWSVQGIFKTAEQLLIGLAIGLAFTLAVSVISVLGYLFSSQMGLAMALMNDPLNGSSSDVVTAFLYVLCILVLFSLDTHLVFFGVLGESFRAWPVGHTFEVQSIRSLVLQVSWVFSAALLLAVPLVFSAMVVQIGFGFVTRIAPALNLFSLGFAMVTLFGLMVLSALIRYVPEHYVRLLHQVLSMLQRQMHAR